MIDKDNLKADESVGTFRWNDSIELLDAPAWRDEFSQLLPQLNGGWQVYLAERFQETAKGEKGEIVVQPHQIDGLSFAMTLVRLIALIRFYKKKKLNIVMMGASAKVEQRLYCKTNYFEELTNFYPDMTLNLHIVGPELSTDIHGKTVAKNERLSAKFYRGMTSEFLDSLPAKLSVNDAENEKAILEALPLQETIFVGFNPGFGSGYEPLLHSWCLDLVRFADLLYPVFFTQANDFSDLRGE